MCCRIQLRLLVFACREPAHRPYPLTAKEHDMPKYFLSIVEAEAA